MAHFRAKYQLYQLYYTYFCAQFVRISQKDEKHFDICTKERRESLSLGELQGRAVQTVHTYHLTRKVQRHRRAEDRNRLQSQVRDAAKMVHRN